MQGDSILHVLCREGQDDAVAAVLNKGVDDVNMPDKVIISYWSVTNRFYHTYTYKH